MKQTVNPTRIYLRQSEENQKEPITLNFLQDINTMLNISGKLKMKSLATRKTNGKISQKNEL